MSSLSLLAAALVLHTAAAAAPTSVLFVGNNYTFGRIDPLMSYNAANVRDLTAAMFVTNPQGSNAFEPHPWCGVAGIFKQFTVQAGLDYDVAISARNAATLRGQLLNSNPANWDLRGNIASQSWSQVVLQEQCDEPLTRRTGLASNPDYFKNYADKIEEFVHGGAAHSFRERDFFLNAAATDAEKTAACQAATGATAATCNLLRSLPANSFASATTKLYLYQTRARPNLVSGAFATTVDPVTGAVTRTSTPATTFFSSLENMTDELRDAYAADAALAAADGTGDFAAIAPVGQAFMRAVSSGVATRDFWATNASSDGLIDLWSDDGPHASKTGSYLSALTLYGTLTGLNPMALGGQEIAARDLGISRVDAVMLQRIAASQLALDVAEPGTLAFACLALAALMYQCRRAG